MTHPQTVEWNNRTFTFRRLVTDDTRSGLYEGDRNYWIVRGPDGRLVPVRTLALARRVARTIESMCKDVI